MNCRSKFLFVTMFALVGNSVSYGATTRPSTRPMATDIIDLSDGSSLINIFWESDESSAGSSGNNLKYRLLHSKLLLRPKDKPEILIYEQWQGEDSTGMWVFQPQSSLMAATLADNGMIVLVMNEWGRGVVKVAACDESGHWNLLPEASVTKDGNPFGAIEEESIAPYPTSASVRKTSDRKVVLLTIDSGDLTNVNHREFMLLFDDKGWSVEQSAPSTEPSR